MQAGKALSLAHMGLLVPEASLPSHSIPAIRHAVNPLDPFCQSSGRGDLFLPITSLRETRSGHESRSHSRELDGHHCDA